MRENADQINSEYGHFLRREKANQYIRHLLDMEFDNKSRLDDLYNHNYLSKVEYKFLKSYVAVNQALCMDYPK